MATPTLSNVASTPLSNDKKLSPAAGSVFLSGRSRGCPGDADGARFSLISEEDFDVTAKKAHPSLEKDLRNVGRSLRAIRQK